MQTIKDVNKNDLVKDWVEKTDPSNPVDDDIETESTVSSSAYTSSIVTDSDISDLSKNFENVHIPKEYAGNVVFVNNTVNTQNIQPIDATLNNCSNVHFGDKYYIKGVLIMSPDEKTLVKQHLSSKPKSNSLQQSEGEEVEESVGSKYFINKPASGMDSTVLRIVERRFWLAQPPMEEPQPLDRPVPYVIISHTASESGENHADLMLLIRTMQQFHVESKKWNDIAYNFCIGINGSVYEGRSWNSVGAHTMGYNKKSIGITFVGTFMNKLPPKASLEACKLLIQHGVNEGHIAQDYKILCHNQCSSTESPGKMLTEEIKTWPHWSSDP